MFEDIELTYVILPVFFIVFGFIVITRNRYSIVTGLKFRTVLFGIVLTILWFSLPSTPSLASFGYPYDVTDIASPEKTLKLFQKYNAAIVRTTEVVHYMLFVFVFWFLFTFYDLIRLVDSKKDNETP